jgi:hypothetical protein
MKGKNCQGCASIETCAINYNLKWSPDRCPCGICLVKMRCTNETCQDYKRYAIQERINYKNIKTEGADRRYHGSDM